MQVKLSGPGSEGIMSMLTSFFTAATEACQAFAMKSVAEMKQKEVELSELHRRRQLLESNLKRLEGEVKVMEERKRKALPAKVEQAAKPAQQHMRSNTKPLTPEQMALAQVRREEEAAARKAEAEAKRAAPLTHQIKGLTLSVNEPEAEQQEA